MPPTPPAVLSCDQCGYDLRAHPPDGRCPECGSSIAESRRLSTIPRRPAWRDSDPRWRRRILAGVWVLVLLPLVDALLVSGWASNVPVPTVLSVCGSVRTLDDTAASDRHVYSYLMFCIGMALLFAKERDRRTGRMDWIRRWGVICSYVALLLSAVEILFITSLVWVNVAAICLSIRLKYQPAMTLMLARISGTYLRYGPQPTPVCVAVLFAFSSLAVLLACVPLFDALRSSGSKRLAIIVLAPLALFALIHLGQAVSTCFDASNLTLANPIDYQVYFRPTALVKPLEDPSAYPSAPAPTFNEIAIEDVKWCIVLTIAIWLTIAQLKTWWPHKNTRPVPPAAP